MGLVFFFTFGYSNYGTAAITNKKDFWTSAKKTKNI